MRKGLFCLVAIVAAGVIFAMAGVSSACGLPTPPSDPPPIVIIIIVNPPVNQRVTVKVCVELETIFPTTTPHHCSCALVMPKQSPADTNVLDAQFARVDLAGGRNDVDRIKPITEFDELAPDDEATAGWRAGPKPQDRDVLGQPISGGDLFGFAGLVQPVTPPPLEANQIYAMVTTIEVPEAQLSFFTSNFFQIGAGVGNPDGSPLFDPNDEHSARLSVMPVPPAVWAGLGLMGALADWQKRRAWFGR